MKNIRCAAYNVGMFLFLIAAVGLFSGCGNSYAEKPLLTYESEEMQLIQAELDADQDAQQVLQDAESELGAKGDTRLTARPPVVFAPETSPTATSATGLRLTSAKITPPELPSDAANNRPPQTAKGSSSLTNITSPLIDPVKLLPTKPREVKLLVPDKSFQKVEPDGALRVSYDDVDLLKILNMDPVSLDAPELMPKWLKELDGKRIRLRGFMFPPFSQTGIPAFVLARDNEICCFGRNPKPYDVIQIVMRKGVTTNYIQNRPFDVVGTFHIEMLTYDDKKVDGLYLIDDAIVMD